MRLAESVEPVLAVHVEAGGRRFKGVRHSVTWEDDPAAILPSIAPARHLLRDERFRAGVAAGNTSGPSRESHAPTRSALDHAMKPMPIGGTRGTRWPACRPYPDARGTPLWAR